MALAAPDDLTPEERLRIQNELRRAQLSDEHGAFFGETSPDLPPELEAQFLANIAALEAGGRESYVPIRSLLPPELLTQAETLAGRGEHQAAIDALLEGLLAAGVFTDQQEWMHARAYYKFLVTDLLDHRIPEPPPAEPDAEQRHAIGVMYDQVRSDSPNHMATVTELFVQDLLHPGKPFTGELLAKVCRDGTEVANKATATASIRRWKEQWTDIVPVAFGTDKPLRGPDGAVYFQFGCEYHVTDKRGNKEIYDGPGLTQLALEDGEFRVVGCVMEGFQM